jgi:signal peptidase I
LVEQTDRLPGDDEATSDVPLSRREREHVRKKNRTRSTIEWIVVIGAAIVIALVLRTFVLQTFYIPSDSMVPTLQQHDRVVVSKLSYHLHSVHRGDIVVFTTPKGVNPSFKDLVKRVVGLPGETVQGKGSHVFVNDKQLPEKYLPHGVFTSDFGPVTVPANSYWVMGDNRGDSEDSRVFHAIPGKTIVGRVFVRIWPLNRIGIF